MAHGRRMEAWRNWVGMCRLFPYSMRYVCGALLMIVLGFRGYYLLGAYCGGRAPKQSSSSERG